MDDVSGDNSAGDGQPAIEVPVRRRRRNIVMFGTLQLCLFYLSLRPGPFLGGAYPTDPHHRDLAEQVGDVLIGLGIIQWGFEGLPP